MKSSNHTKTIRQIIERNFDIFILFVILLCFGLCFANLYNVNKSVAYSWLLILSFMLCFSLSVYYSVWRITSYRKAKILEKSIEIENKEVMAQIDALKSEVENDSITSLRLKEIYSMLFGRTFNSNINSHILPIIVRNPNCPPDVFAHLVLPYPNDAAQNPAFELMLLEGEFLPKIPRSTARYLLSRQDISPKIVHAFTMYPNRYIREEAAHHVHIAGEIADDDTTWEATLADFLVKNSRQDDRVVAFKLFDALPEWVEIRLEKPVVVNVHHEEDKTDQEDFSFKRERFLEACVSAKEILVRFLALMHLTQTDEHDAFQLKNVKSHTWRERLAIALNPRTSFEVRMLLAKDGNQYVCAVAQKYLNDSKWVFFAIAGVKR
jgi:hypothetical protein